MSHCDAYGCYNNSGTPECNGTSFFGFPMKNRDNLNQWMDKIKRQHFQPNEHSKLCSDHFTENCFKYQNSTNRRLLKRGAIPTKFPSVVEITPRMKMRRGPSNNVIDDVQALSSSASIRDITQDPGTSTKVLSVSNDKGTQTDVTAESLSDKSLYAKKKKLDLATRAWQCFHDIFNAENEKKQMIEALTCSTNTMQSSPQIFQFKVTYGKIKPVWRRIQVLADYDFRDLHFAIQSAMGWSNSHLYKFTIKKNPKSFFEVEVGEVEGGEDIVSAQSIKLLSFFPTEYQVLYTYDFGRCWEHRVVLEKILPVVEGEKYPKCIAGRRACPLEDMYSDSDDAPEPVEFDLKNVNFDNLDRDPFGKELEYLGDSD